MTVSKCFHLCRNFSS